MTKSDLAAPTRRDCKGNSGNRIKIHTPTTTPSAWSKRTHRLQLGESVSQHRALHVGRVGGWASDLIMRNVFICNILREFEMEVKKEFESFLSVHFPEASLG